VVWFPPGEKHWHGATATTGMSHGAIAERLDGKAVDWLEKVRDEGYQAAVEPAARSRSARAGPCEGTPAVRHPAHPRPPARREPAPTTSLHEAQAAGCLPLIRREPAALPRNPCLGVPHVGDATGGRPTRTASWRLTTVLPIGHSERPASFR
jgi:hypothetical protein